MNHYFTKRAGAVLLSGLIAVSASVEASDFAIVNLSPDEMSLEALNTTYTSGTSSIHVSTGNMNFDGTYTTNCVPFAGQTGALYFDKFTAPNYSFVIIDNIGTDNITSIKLIGSSTAGISDVPVAFSGKSSSETDDQAYSENLDWLNPGVPFYTPAEGGGCQEHTVTLPDPANTASGEEILFVGSIKIAVTTDFGTEYSNALQKPFKLESIAVYTNKQTDTGIGSRSGDSFTVYVCGDELNLSETALEVSVCTVSGQLIQTAKNTQTVPIRSLSSGLYVVKAVSDTGKHTVAKIAR
jgi:hypothetical protein